MFKKEDDERLFDKEVEKNQTRRDETETNVKKYDPQHKEMAYYIIYNKERMQYHKGGDVYFDGVYDVDWAAHYTSKELALSLAIRFGLEGLNPEDKPEDYCVLEYIAKVDNIYEATIENLENK